VEQQAGECAHLPRIYEAGGPVPWTSTRCCGGSSTAWSQSKCQSAWRGRSSRVRQRVHHYVEELQARECAHLPRTYEAGGPVPWTSRRCCGGSWAAWARTVYASYTNQHVPSVQREADEFCATQVRQGSKWECMLEHAREKHYDGLKGDLATL
jgi:hypothetical protein